MPGGGEPGHVHTDLGDDDRGGDRSDPGHFVKTLYLLVERGQVGLDLGVQHRNVRVDGIDPVQHAFQQEPVVLTEAAPGNPANASSSSLILARIRALARSASTPGSRSPAISAANIARPETPKMSLATTDSLTPASSSSFSTLFFSAVRAATRSMR